MEENQNPPAGGPNTQPVPGSPLPEQSQSQTINPGDSGNKLLAKFSFILGLIEVLIPFLFLVFVFYLVGTSDGLSFFSLLIFFKPVAFFAPIVFGVTNIYIGMKYTNQRKFVIHAIFIMAISSVISIISIFMMINFVAITLGYPPNNLPTLNQIIITPTPNQNQVDSFSAGKLSCSNINLNPPELTFEAAFCNNTIGCSDAKTQTECKALDVVKVENDSFVSGQDGERDCAWVENSCRNNK